MQWGSWRSESLPNFQTQHCTLQESGLVVFIIMPTFVPLFQVNRAYIKREKHDSDSESSSGRGSTVDIVSSMAGPKLSLSERFGRMAQWSVDRDLEHRNLRITSGDRLTVEMDSPPSPLYPPYVMFISFLLSFVFGFRSCLISSVYRRFQMWRFFCP